MPASWISRVFLGAVALLLPLLAACSGGDDLVLGATTSLQDTGILDELVSAFERESGRDVTYRVGGSGEVLEFARRGEVDVVITHSPEAEEELIAEGEAVERRAVMENFFLIVGPEDDPAGVGEARTASEAFNRIAQGRQTFISRGDESGTHVRELAIWQQAGMEPQGQPWYQESATGQGQNLLIASDKGAYTLVDNATFRVFEDRVDLVELFVDKEAPNVYSVITVSPEKHRQVNAEAARAFAEFLTSAEAQRLIAGFGVEEHGKSLFTPIVTRAQ